MSGQLDEVLFDPSKALTIRNTRGGVVRVEVMPDDRWHIGDLGIEWMDTNGWSHIVPWTAIEEVVQQP